MYFEEGLERIQKLLNNIDNRRSNIVMWGVGKYAINVLMNTEIINRIDFFVDSNNYGKIFFGKKVFSPNEIEWKNIDIVIVAVYYAANEIVENIKRISEFSGSIIDTSVVSECKPFYEYESIKQVHIKENDIYLSRNIKFMNSSTQKKCYILGNGPSSRKHDLSKLRDETVFVVNDFFRFENADKIHPNYYVLKDYSYFSKYIDNLKDIANVRKYNEDLKFFLPLYCYQENKELLDNLFGEDAYFFSPTRKIDNYTIVDIDISKEIPQVQATIHAAIFIAIYMGYKEIYLVGCEETAVIGCIQMFLSDSNVNIHSYSCDEKILKIYCDNCRNEELDNLLNGFSIIFKNYKIINQMCIDGDVSLYTCAEETLLKNVKYCSYEDSFK